MTIPFFKEDKEMVEFMVAPMVLRGMVNLKAKLSSPQNPARQRPNDRSS
jgi:hypothetical protein